MVEKQMDDETRGTAEKQRDEETRGFSPLSTKVLKTP